MEAAAAQAAGADAKSVEVLQLLARPDGLGGALLSLLAEQMFLLPLTRDQLNSRALWGFLDAAAEPCMEALGKLESFDPNEARVCTDLLDILERVYYHLVRRDLWEKAMGDSDHKGPLLTLLAEDVEAVLAKRQKTPEHLEEVFKKECARLKTDVLDMAQFVQLMKNILGETEEIGNGKGEKKSYEAKGRPSSPHFLASEPSRNTSTFLHSMKTPMKAMSGGDPSRRAESKLEKLFRKADEDGSNSIDLYEFNSLCKLVSRSTQQMYLLRSRFLLVVLLCLITLPLPPPPSPFFALPRR